MANHSYTVRARNTETQAIVARHPNIPTLADAKRGQDRMLEQLKGKACRVELWRVEHKCISSMKPDKK